MKKYPAFLLISLCVASLTACTVGPDYARPTAPEQSGWKGQTVSSKTAVLPPDWWRIFKDSELNKLEGQAIAANQDLQRAVARVTEARAFARYSKADQYPSLTADGSYSRNRASANSAEFPEGSQRPTLESNDYR